MADILWVLAFFVGMPLALMVAIRWLVRRMGARFRSEGAIADATTDADGRFVLDVEEGGPIALFLRYGLDGTSRSGRGAYWGMTVLLEVRREPASTGYRAGAPAFVHRYEYLIANGQARGQAPVASALAHGPLVRNGLHISRGLLLVRVPAGGRLTARGRIDCAAGTECTQFLLFAKPGKG